MEKRKTVGGSGGGEEGRARAMGEIGLGQEGTPLPSQGREGETRSRRRLVGLVARDGEAAVGRLRFSLQSRRWGHLLRGREATGAGGLRSVEEMEGVLY